MTLRHWGTGILFLMLGASAAPGQDWRVAAIQMEGQELVLRPTVEGRRKLYVDGPYSGDAYVLLRGDRLFPLRASEPVKVTKATARPDRLELEITSARLGRGRVDFHGPPPDAEGVRDWLREVFETDGPGDVAPYIGNRETRVLHIRGANHLPPVVARESFRDRETAAAQHYRHCGVCFMPTPTVPDYASERALSMVSLRHVRSTFHPSVDSDAQRYVSDIGADVLLNWPLPLKGYRYRFQVVESDDVNAFAVPAGHVFVTRGLLDALETEDELAAVLAHEIVHVENRHGYRAWRNSQRAAAVLGVLGAIAGGTRNVVDDIVTAMSAVATNIFLSGFGRDREHEADLIASLFLRSSGRSEDAMQLAFQKLKFASDAIDPFRDGHLGLFASHPNIDERLERAATTRTETFPDDAVFHGLNRAGELVATLRLDVQRVYGRELDVIATISTTAELGQRDTVNALTLDLGGERLQMREVTAESIFPSDEASAVFRTSRTDLIAAPVTGVGIRLRNVDRWVSAIGLPR